MSNADIAGVVRSIEHYLGKLELFEGRAVYPPSNPANKTNGWTGAKVPEWQLRQWVARLTGPVEVAAEEYDDRPEWELRTGFREEDFA